jgi:hypothetical protein
MGYLNFLFNLTITKQQFGLSSQIHDDGAPTVTIHLHFTSQGTTIINCCSISSKNLHAKIHLLSCAH